MTNRNGRTSSAQRLHPIRRCVSRYGLIERTLIEMKAEGVKEFGPHTVAKRIERLHYRTVKGIFNFTKGIKRDKITKMYTFKDDEQIMVDAGWAIKL